MLKSGTNHELTAITAPVAMVAAFSVHNSDVERDFVVAEFTDSAPKPAFLCTFLI